MDFAIDADISKAKTLPTDFYLNKDVFEIKKKKFFASSWQFIGDKDMIKDNGTAYPVTLLEDFLDEPIVITKDKNDNFLK